MLFFIIYFAIIFFNMYYVDFFLKNELPIELFLFLIEMMYTGK